MKPFLHAHRFRIGLLLAWVSVYALLACVLYREAMTVILLPDYHRISWRYLEVQWTRDSTGTRLVLPYNWPETHRLGAGRFAVWRVAKGGEVGWYIWVPYWPFLVVGSLVIAAKVRNLWKNLMQSLRSQRWARSGCCRMCGYDLRASKDRCPECGAVGQENGSS